MKNIYKTKEWNYLSPQPRAELIPTIEDIRPGSIITINKDKNNQLEYILEETGLKYRKEKGILLFVSKDKDLLDRLEIWTTEEGTREEDKIKFHKIYGSFLGYPECCIDKFILDLSKELRPLIEWRKKVKRAMKKGTYNNVLDYRFHFPCRINCKKSLILAKDIKRVLEKNDIEAANSLKRIKIVK